MIKIFAHRGFVTKNAAENSIASLDEARKNNFIGVEFDLWFVDSKLVLNHDLPQKNQLKNLPNLRDYFIFQNNFEYWLDFKNLDESNIIKALEVVKKEIELAKIDLDKIYFAPFITNFDKALKVYDVFYKMFEKPQIVAVCDNLSSQNFLQYYKILQENKIKFLSIDHNIIDENFIKIFREITLFAWTVNDLERLKFLEKLGVKNFTSDKITPQIYEKFKA